MIARAGFILSVCFALVACDPAYHLSYAVVNDSRTPFYCVDASGIFEKGKPFRVDPDSSVVVYEEAGFGEGREQFRNSKVEVTARFKFYSDSTCTDSVLLQPGKSWKYYTLPKGGNNVRLYVKNSDFRK